MMYSLSDFDFELPPELIAQTALPDRTASRLLHVSDDAALLIVSFLTLSINLTPVIC